MISNLQKDKSLIEVLNKLFHRYGESNFYLTDFWDADLCAIGIKNSIESEYLIYISTYRIKKNRYFVEVEDSNKEVVLNGYKNGELRELNFEELSKIVSEYLHIQPIYEQ